MPGHNASVAWVSSWDRRCGIADYSHALWPSVERECRAAFAEPPELVSLDGISGPVSGTELLRRLIALRPRIVHFQHEYGLYGGKNPPAYAFPRWVRRLRRELPGTRIIATGHTILAGDYSFPERGRGWETPVRWLANRTILPALRHSWGPGTWGSLDGVIVHSRLQTAEVSAAAPGAAVAAIPHFVATLAPESQPGDLPGTLRDFGRSDSRWVLVFGFFTPEKGQDVAIQALADVRDPSVLLVLAGGVRRDLDEPYHRRCLQLIDSAGLGDRVRVTGFVEPGHLDALYRRASLVLAPFRETSGSGSLAVALARGAPILASDLPLNRELGERESGSLAFFRSGDPADCARRITELLADPAAIEGLRASAQRYARAWGPDRVAAETVSFYRKVLSRPAPACD
jgi:glycosyltransferase involved in cell wall biosynthesis